jgi:uncharacterized small protein (DUF1192 family)
MIFRTLVVSLAVGSFFATNPVYAEQKIIFGLETIKHQKDTKPASCELLCSYKDAKPGVDELIKEGWKIVTTSPKEIIASELQTHYFDYPNGTRKSLIYGCDCVGTQYVLQKEEIAPAPKVDTQNKEVELLKKETELLKQEIALLKQENETLKAQLKPKKKKTS